MTLQLLDDGDHSVVPADPQVVRWATSWVRTTRELARFGTERSAGRLRSSDCASSTITKASCSERPRMCVSGRTSSIPRLSTSSMTSRPAPPRGCRRPPAPKGSSSRTRPRAGSEVLAADGVQRPEDHHLWCCLRSSTASRPAHSASADFRVPARPAHRDDADLRVEEARSRAIRCSALRPCSPKASRSPRTSLTLPSAVTRPRALPRSDCRTSPVCTGSSAASGTYSRPRSRAGRSAPRRARARSYRSSRHR